MNAPYLYFTIAFFALGGICLVAAVVMFFNFRIPMLIKDMRGSLEKKQIGEIRNKNAMSQHQRNKINVFEELEKNAKVKKPQESIRLRSRATAVEQTREESGTSVLVQPARQVNPNFIIEKNIVFVSTNEVI